MCRCVNSQRRQRYKYFTYIPNKNQSILLMKERNILKEFISERFISICERLIHRYNIVSRSGFYQKIQIHSQVYSDIKNKKLYVSIEHISNLLTAFDNVSVQWIFAGVGEMFIYDTNKQKIAIDNFNKVLRDNLTPDKNYSVVAEDIPPYESTENGYLEKYIKKLECDNKRLEIDNQKKQELIDEFMRGGIVVNKKAM